MTPNSVRQAKEVLVKLIEDLVFEPEKEALSTALQIIDEWEKMSRDKDYYEYELDRVRKLGMADRDKIAELEAELARYKTALEWIQERLDKKMWVYKKIEETLAGAKEII
jgi:hypothetical protein